MRGVWFVGVLAVTTPDPAWARSGGIFGRSNGCSTCHGGASSDVVGTLQGPTSVNAGETATYTLTIETSDTAHVSAGFSLQAFGGTLVPGTGTRANGTSLTQTGPRSLIGGTTSWTFEWTAPPQGTVAFSAAVLGVDRMSGANAADRWATVPGLLVSVVPAPPDTDASVDTDPQQDTDGGVDSDGPAIGETDGPVDTDARTDPDTGAPDSDPASAGVLDERASDVEDPLCNCCCTQPTGSMPFGWALLGVVFAARRGRG